MPGRFEVVSAPLEERLGDGLLHLAYSTLSFGEQMHSDLIECINNHTTIQRASDAAFHAILPSKMPFWMMAISLIIGFIRRMYLYTHARSIMNGHDFGFDLQHEKTE